jgi:ABC-type nickel/cobalt efflux system permease component RcnA
MQADEHAHDYCARELMRLHHRSRLLDSAVVLGAIGGGLSCFAALLLFIGAFGRSVAAANVLLAVFGLALTMTIGSIAAFVGENGALEPRDPPRDFRSTVARQFRVAIQG